MTRENRSKGLARSTPACFRARSLAATCALALACSTACATLRPEIVIRTFGTVNPERDEALADKAAKLRLAPNEVEVIVGSLPVGLDISDEGQKLVVLSGYEDTYEVLGTVEADFHRAASAGFFRNLFWAWDYPQLWRKILCYPQVPLKIASLSAWNLVPTAYPCYAAYQSMSEREREEFLVAEVRRGGQAMGGDTVVVTQINSRNAVVGDQYTITTVTTTMVSMRGFVLRTGLMPKPAPAPVPEPETEPETEPSEEAPKPAPRASPPRSRKT